MNIYEKLLNIQNELKAPKNQFNKFGNYKYRNAEDILEAVKPICLKYKAVINVGDTIIQVGDRYYVEARAFITDVENPTEYIENRAFAREEENKKGMDTSQVTGATSSYARKYALNGLLCIDDTKDTDSEEYQQRGISKTTSKKIETEEEARNLKITFGKYNGKTIGEIYEAEDIKYLEWLFDKSNDENIKKAVSILTGLVEKTPEESKKEINEMPIQETQKQRIKDKYKDNLDQLQLEIANLGKIKLSQLTYEEANKLLEVK